MPSHNEYHGYIKLPKKKLYEHLIRLDFNGNMETSSKGTKVEGFSLRMFTIDQDLRGEHPEIGVKLTSEQWLDLIDAMKAEFELVQEDRKKLDGLR